MLILSFERLGAVNRQPNLSKSISWLNSQLKADVAVYQSLDEMRVVTSRYPVLPYCRRLALPKRMGVYNGLNCVPFCFDPYRDLFHDYGFPYVELTDEDIRAGALSDMDVLVVPGGPDAGESYYAGLGDKGQQEVKDFVARGGGYRGSCAGAYFPLTARSGSPAQRMWLNIVSATDPAGLDYWRTGTGFVRVALNTSTRSPMLFGLGYGEPSTVDVIYWEGPAFHGLDDQTRVLATYQELVGSGDQMPKWQVNHNQCASDALAWSNPLTQERFDTHLQRVPAAIETHYGKGRLVLYSFHPEFGSPSGPVVLKSCPSVYY